jgi:Siphovirus Gp157
MREPSPRQISEAFAVIHQYREFLLEADAAALNHVELVAGEVEPRLDVALTTLERVIRCTVDADDAIAACRIRIEEVKSRLARYTQRRDKLRELAFQLMQALGLHKLERGDFTAAMRKQGPRVMIINPSEVPDKFWRVSREPDKLAIMSAISNGETVPGAELSNAGEALAIYSG